MCVCVCASLILRLHGPTSPLPPPLQFSGSYRAVTDLTFAPRDFCENWHTSDFQRFIVMLRGTVHCRLAPPPVIQGSDLRPRPRSYSQSYTQHCLRDSNDRSFPPASDLTTAAACSVEAGQLLYVPAGHWLECRAQADSVWLTIALLPLTYGDWVLSMLRHVAAPDPTLSSAALLPAWTMAGGSRPMQATQNMETTLRGYMQDLLVKLRLLTPAMQIPAALSQQVPPSATWVLLLLDANVKRATTTTTTT